MRTRSFYVTGMKPAYGKEINDLLKASDLGMEGIFIPFAGKVTVKMSDEATKDQRERQPDGIKSAYEQMGCVAVAVLEEEEFVV